MMIILIHVINDKFRYNRLAQHFIAILTQISLFLTLHKAFVVHVSLESLHSLAQFSRSVQFRCVDNRSEDIK